MVIKNIKIVVLGETQEIKLILPVLLSGGHVFLKDVPGTDKTVLAKTLARSFECGFFRVQFTPDLLLS